VINSAYICAGQLQSLLGMNRGVQRQSDEAMTRARGLPVNKAIKHPVRAQYTLNNAHISCTRGTVWVMHYISNFV